MINNCELDLSCLAIPLLFLQHVVPIGQVPCKPGLDNKVSEKREYYCQPGHLIAIFVYWLIFHNLLRMSRVQGNGMVMTSTARNDVIRDESSCDD